MDVMSFAFATLGSLQFIEPPRSTASQILYGQLLWNLSYDSYKTSGVDGHTHTNISTSRLYHAFNCFVKLTTLMLYYYYVLSLCGINKCSFERSFMFSFFPPFPTYPGAVLTIVTAAI